MRRGAITKAGSKLVTVWVPKALVIALNHGVRITDLDKSKFVRIAIREKLARNGIGIPEETA
jgi:hypothetical protein